MGHRNAESQPHLQTQDADPGGTLQMFVSILSQAERGCEQHPQAPEFGPCKQEALEAGYEIAAAGMAEAMRHNGAVGKASKVRLPKRTRTDEGAMQNHRCSANDASEDKGATTGALETSTAEHTRLQRWLDDCMQSVMPSTRKLYCPSQSAEIPLQDMAVPLTDFAEIKSKVTDGTVQHFVF